MFDLWTLQIKRKRSLNRLSKIRSKDANIAAVYNDPHFRSEQRKLAAIERQIRDISSIRLIRQAETYDIPIPSIDPPQMDEEYEQTVEFRAEVRKLIHDEQTRRREANSWWWKTVIIPAITALTGLAGAITGMIAVIHAIKK